MDLAVIVDAQRPVWYIFIQPLAALVFYIAALAELQRAPFDLLEAEQELSAGFNVEYAGMRFGMFFMAEYMKMISLSAIFATFFLGGYRGPFVDQFPWLGIVYILAKIIASLFVMIWIRATLPRFRYDQLMGFGWKTLLPIAVLNFIVTAVLIVMAEEGTLPPLIESVKLFFAGYQLNGRRPIVNGTHCRAPTIYNRRTASGKNFFVHGFDERDVAANEVTRHLLLIRTLTRGLHAHKP